MSPFELFWTAKKTVMPCVNQYAEERRYFPATEAQLVHKALASNHLGLKQKIAELFLDDNCSL